MTPAHANNTTPHAAWNGAKPTMTPRSMRSPAPFNRVIAVPDHVARCPYCGAALQVQVVGWTQREDMTWGPEQIEVECVTEPCVTAHTWEEWFATHSNMPYVHLLPVEEKIKRWLDNQYDFPLPDRVTGGEA